MRACHRNLAEVYAHIKRRGFSPHWRWSIFQFVTIVETCVYSTLAVVIIDLIYKGLLSTSFRDQIHISRFLIFCLHLPDQSTTIRHSCIIWS